MNKYFIAVYNEKYCENMIYIIYGDDEFDILKNLYCRLDYDYEKIKKAQTCQQLIKCFPKECHISNIIRVYVQTEEQPFI